MGESGRYDDGEIVCDERGLLIRRYYPWGSKYIPYTSIEGVKRLPIRIRRWRFWGSGDLRHSWNLDPNRIHKTVALEIRTGLWVHPTITPDDVDAVETIINEQLATRSSTN